MTEQLTYRRFIIELLVCLDASKLRIKTKTWHHSLEGDNRGRQSGFEKRQREPSVSANCILFTSCLVLHTKQLLEG